MDGLSGRAVGVVLADRPDREADSSSLASSWIPTRHDDQSGAPESSVRSLARSRFLVVVVVAVATGAGVGGEVEREEEEEEEEVVERLLMMKRGGGRGSEKEAEFDTWIGLDQT